LVANKHKSCENSKEDTHMKPKGLSLHIGLNRVDPAHYGGWSGPLVACEADADDMHAIAQEQDYTGTLLKTGDATRAAVITQIRDAAKTLVNKDIFFLSYSGHGGQVPDLSGEEYDLKDETWCLYDGQLIDDELRLLWGEFAKGVRILVLSDSCHSGTVTKAAFYGSRGMTGSLAAGRPPVEESPHHRCMPPQVALRTYRENREFYDQLAAEINAKTKDLAGPSPVRASVRLISGCQDNQYSEDGDFNGLFTGMLLRVWSDGRFKGDYLSFHRQILDRMPPYQSPNHYFIGEWSASYDKETPFTITDNTR
jgi:metacaspase-1